MPASSLLHHVKRTANRLGRSLPGKMGRAFVKDEGGSMAIIFAVALIPIIMMVGAAIDYARIALDRSEVQAAIDAATLAVVKKVNTLNNDEVRLMVEDYVKANTPDSVSVNIDLVEIERNPNSLKIWASGKTDTTFMRMANIENVAFKANSRAVASDKTLEVVLVLDNSGSMGGSRIRGLKTASKELVKILVENQQNPEDLSIGIVPFNHLVRLHSNSTTPSWLDQEAKSSVHRINFPPKSNRFDLLKQMKDEDTGRQIKWDGCMEARAHPYDVNDVAANSNRDDSYYIPFFYPDPREINNTQYSSRNHYLEREGYASGQTRAQKKKFGWYYKQEIDQDHRYGPNYYCYITRLLPLTTNMRTVNAHIDKLKAGGYTNIHMGTIWGLRVLSPQSPYSEGKSYDDHENDKFMIIMSDGANTYSRYGAYGWSSNGRISGSTSVRREMDKRTLESCAAAKADGVMVFTVAYGDLDSSTTTMLRDCATLPENAFRPQNVSEMIKTFKNIAEALNVIRLTD